MCGHVGIVSRNISRDHLDFFEQALYVDALRGEDGTGVAFLDDNFKANFIKKASNAQDFLDLKPYDKMMTKHGLWSKFIMGHNRWATRGGIDNSTSHPFHYGDIIMAHNGSLRVQSHLPDYKDFDVDSENIAYSLDKLGVEDTIKKLDGSYSLVWSNSKNKTVNFIRNNERPMYFGLTKDKKTLLYASEQGMLTWLATRNGIVLESIAASEVDTLYTFNMKKEEKGDLKPVVKVIEGYKFLAPLYTPTKKKHHGNTDAFTNRIEAELKEIGLKKGQRVSFDVTELNYFAQPIGTKRGSISGYINHEPWCDIKIYGYDNFRDQLEVGMSVSAETLSVSTTTTSKGKESVVILDPNTIKVVPEEEELDDTKKIYTGPDKNKLTAFEWDDLTKYGCAECQGNLDISEHNEILWVNRFSPCCLECQDKYTC